MPKLLHRGILRYIKIVFNTSPVVWSACCVIGLLKEKFFVNSARAHWSDSALFSVSSLLAQKVADIICSLYRSPVKCKIVQRISLLIRIVSHCDVVSQFTQFHFTLPLFSRRIFSVSSSTLFYGAASSFNEIEKSNVLLNRKLVLKLSIFLITKKKSSEKRSYLTRLFSLFW